MDRRVAIVGVAARVAGAESADAIWPVVRFAETRISERPASWYFGDRWRAQPAPALKRGWLADADRFDASFFGMSSREALLLDPQHRLLIELCWRALEDAACQSTMDGPRVGLFATTNDTTYDGLVGPGVEPLQLRLSNRDDFLAARVGFRLGLTGACVTVRTACSSSLVAVHLARAALLDGTCDVALVGGVSIDSNPDPQRPPIFSRTGECRPFDRSANGMVDGDGGAVIVMKRHADAVSDGHLIRATLIGSAINNDGADRAGFTAPSPQGQSAVIRAALADAGVSARSIGYVEAHGTGTPVGDPVEFAALCRAFDSGADVRWCGLSSVKANFGHLNHAAGILGLVTAVLALQHRELPPLAGFRQPNPEIDLARSPFQIERTARRWDADGPRRAGVSSFGMGGTNAHCVLEEAPLTPDRAVAPGPHKIALSAKSPAALVHIREALACQLTVAPEMDLRDLAYTLQVGRRRFEYGWIALVHTREQLVELLRGGKREDLGCSEDAVSPRDARRVRTAGHPLNYGRYWPEQIEVLPTFAPGGSDATRGDPSHWESSETIAPSGTVRERLLEQVRAVGGSSPVDASDTFSSIGLDSMGVMDLVIKVEDEFGIKLPDALQEPTRSISDLVLTVEGLIAAGPQRSPPSAAVENLLPADPDAGVELASPWSEPVIVFHRGMRLEFDAAPTGNQIRRRYAEVTHHHEQRVALQLNAGEESLWVQHVTSDNAPAYMIGACIRFAGKLEIHRVEAALVTVARAHPALRTTFSDAGVSGLKNVHARPLIVLDLVKEANVEAVAREMLLQPLDLSSLPLLRTKLLQIGAEEYALILALPHIVADGSGLGNLIADLLTAYQEERIDEHDYADSGPTLGDLDADVAWWRERLTPLPPPVIIPSDQRRRPLSATGALLRTEIDAEQVTHFRTVARTLGVTPFTLAITIFASVIARYAGQSEVIIGTGVTRRSDNSAHRPIGHTVNVVPLRIRLDPHSSLHESVVAVAACIRDAVAHGSCPLSRIVASVNPPRSALTRPLVQVVFGMLRDPFGTFDLPGLRVTASELPEPRSEMELNVEVLERPQGWSVKWRYDVDAYDQPTITRLSERFLLAITRAAADPGQRIIDLPADPQESFARPSWPAQGIRPIADGLLNAFNVAAAKYSSDIAIIEAGGAGISYSELSARVTALASALHAMGVEPGEPVGVQLPRSAAAIVAVLGITAAGGAYVPLDPDEPATRTERMLNQARVRRVIVPGVGEPKLTIKVRSLGDLAPTRYEGVGAVLFTSGSSGTPRGVLVPHAGVLNLISSLPALPARPRMLHLAPLAFDASTFELWTPLLGGGICVVHPPGPVVFEELGRTLLEHGVDSAWLTASLFNAIVDGTPEVLAPLRTLYVGGEALSVPHVRRCISRFPNLTLINGYGPTEATTFTCTYCIPQDLDGSASSVPIGQPLSGVSVYLLDRELVPVPAGAIGELCIAGPGVSPGYAGDPEGTAARFVRSTFGGGQVLYRTGDLARVRASGDLEFVERMDTQTKMHGFRIEPAEIEATLCEHPEVARAAVLTRVQGQMSIFAAIVLRPDAPDDTRSLSTLRGFAAARLPAHMIPRTWLVVDALPITTAGKLDRHSLEKAFLSGTSDHAPATPANDLERVIADAWREILGATHLPPDLPFFEAGGDSLAAARVVGRLRRAGYSVAVKDLFAAPTIRGLAAILQQTRSHSDFNSSPSTKHLNGALTPAQRELWMLDELTSPLPLNNVWSVFEVHGALDSAAWAAAINEIVARHPALRTRVVLDGEEPRRIPQDCQALGCLEVECSDAEAAFTWIADFVHERIDPASPPLLRSAIAFIAPDRRVVAVVTHHLACDGWSLGVLNRELGALYEIHRARRASSQIGRLSVGSAMRSSPSIPSDLAETYTGMRDPLTIDPRLFERLATVAHKCSVTPFAFLMTAFGLTVAQDHDSDVQIAIPVARRDKVEVENVVDSLNEWSAVRLNLRTTTLRALLEQAQREVISALESGGAVPRAPSSRIRPTVPTLVLHSAPMRALVLTGCRVELLEVPSRWVKHELRVSLWPRGGGLQGVMERSGSWRGAPELRDRMLRSITLLCGPHALDESPRALFADAGELTEARMRLRQAVRRPVQQGTSPRDFDVCDLVPGRLSVISWANRRAPVIASDLLRVRDRIEEELTTRGAILLRGLGLQIASDLRVFAQSLSHTPMTYIDQSSPRTPICDSVYTSTEYPSSQSIGFHNELSYSGTWPKRLFFGCLQPADRGGRTPLADGRRVLARLSPAVREAFGAGVMYRRVLGGGLGVSWQRAFQTQHRADAEAVCRSEGIAFDWLDGDRLRTVQVRPAMIAHPVTGELSWFNHAAFFHPSNLPPALRVALNDVPDAELPFCALLANGRAIPDELISEVQTAYREEAFEFDWQAGDVLIVDNILIAHARAPYEGERLLVVTMANPQRHVGT